MFNKRIFFLGLLLLPFISSSHRNPSAVTQDSKPADADITAITRATLIDGSGHAPVKNSVVVVKGDSIMAVGSKGQVQIPAGARLIDARGLAIAPGFMDTH